MGRRCLTPSPRWVLPPRGRVARFRSSTTGGRRPTLHELTPASLTGIVCMLCLGGLFTSIGYWLWGRLLRDYPAAQVVPFALLVPFVGAGASSILFGEKFGPLRLAGMISVIGGIAIMVLAKRPQPLAKIA